MTMLMNRRPLGFDDELPVYPGRGISPSDYNPRRWRISYRRYGGYDWFNGKFDANDYIVRGVDLNGLFDAKWCRSTAVYSCAWIVPACRVNDFMELYNRLNVRQPMTLFQIAGIVTTRHDADRIPKTLRPYLDHTLEQIGHITIDSIERRFDLLRKRVTDNQRDIDDLKKMLRM